MAGIIGALASRHDIAALYLRGKDEPPFDPALAKLCDLVEEVPRDADSGLKARLHHRARVAMRQLCGWPHWAAYWGAGPFGDRALDLAARWQPDVVHLEYHVMGQFAHIATGSGAAVVLTLYEPAAAAAEERAHVARGSGRLTAWLEKQMWRRFERGVSQKADAIVVFTRRDLKAVEALAVDTPIVHIPLGISATGDPLNPTGAAPSEVLFVGNFMHPPNVDAAIHLVYDVAPQVWNRAPDTTIVLVGPEPPAAVRALASPLVQVQGEVKDVSHFMDRAAIVVAPIRLGGGMRLKVLEALAAGKAVVATPRAVEGLDVLDGVHLRVAEGPTALADAIVDLLINASIRQRLAVSAREWVSDTLSPGRWADAYDGLYETLDTRRAGNDSSANQPIVP